MIVQAIPVLYTTDLNATIRFYESTLGFNATNHGSQMVLQKEDVTIHFILCIDKTTFTTGSCCIMVNDLQCFFTKLAVREIIYPENRILDLPGRKKGFTIKDNNGNLLHFVQEF